MAWTEPAIHRGHEPTVGQPGIDRPPGAPPIVTPAMVVRAHGEAGGRAGAAQERPTWQNAPVGRVGPPVVGPGGRGGWAGRRAAVLLGLVLLLVLGSSRAGAAGLGERVLDFTSDAEVEADGSLLVHE